MLLWAAVTLWRALQTCNTNESKRKRELGSELGRELGRELNSPAYPDELVCDELISYQSKSNFFLYTTSMLQLCHIEIHSLAKQTFSNSKQGTQTGHTLKGVRMQMLTDLCVYKKSPVKMVRRVCC